MTRHALAALAAFVLGSLLSAAGLGAGPVHHDMTVVLDPQARRLQVVDRLRVDARQEIVLRLDARFSFSRFLIDGGAVSPNKERDAAGAPWQVRIRAPLDRPTLVEVSYSGELDALDTALDPRRVLDLSRPMAGSEGVFAPAAGGWYLHDERALVTYRMKVIVPAGFRALVAGKVLAESSGVNSVEAEFESSDPLPGIDLLAGPYTVSERLVRLTMQREVRVRTYFHKELESLAGDYLDSAAEYLLRYDRSIGPYAFATYNIVSSPLPTGFGMPGIAYLGRQVLRLPFIRTTSLGHEVLHDWWGNGVYPDFSQGNWSEGLTTFLADYAFKEDASAAQAQAMRLAWLRDFAAVRPEHDRPLNRFISRRHGADQAVGYNKTAFVFYMLRELIGDKLFQEGLRRFWANHRFRLASWDDLRHTFESVGQNDLQAYFSQWLTRPGAPEIALASVRQELHGARRVLLLELRQAVPAYRLRLPLRVYLDDGTSIDTGVELDREVQRVVLEVPSRAQSVAIDPEVRIFRRLDSGEIAPILRQVMLDRRTALAQASSDRTVRDAAMKLAEATLEHIPRPRTGVAIDDTTPLLIVGLHADVAQFLVAHRLPSFPSQLQNRGSAFVYAGRSRQGQAYAVVAARDSAALTDLVRPLPHLGAQSFSIFDGGRSIERGVWPVAPRRYPVAD